jgi:hypothetical protein
VDEPLIIIFDQLEALGLAYNENLLSSFGDAIKELFTHVPNSLIILNLFPDRWGHFKVFFDGAVVDRISQCQIVLSNPSTSKLKEMLILKAWAHQIDIEHVFSSEDLEIILNQESIRGVLNWASHYYRYRVEGIAVPKATHFKRFEDDLKEEIQSLKQQIANVSTGNTVDVENIVRHELETFSQFTGFAQEMRESLQAIREEIAALRQVLEIKVSTIPVSTDKPISQLPIPNSTEKISLVENDNAIVSYFKREQQLLEETFTDFTIISDADDVGKLRVIAEEFCPLRGFELDFLRLGKKTLPEHLLLTRQDKGYAVGFLHAKGNAFTTRIQNFNQLVINDTSIQFILFRDEREPAITAKVGASEIKKLNNAPNGHFVVMDRENRIIFELLAKLVTDILNKEEDFSLQEALEAVEVYFSDYWLIKLLTGRW